MKNRFFTKLDWAAFWTATLLTFLVYFLTLGPSVGLEDSGELATAAANLGVPHPPGYPFWTFCSWLFCKAFSWVTYMGYPNPAWCVSLCSATFGAFAAGCTAMLICRSANDFIADAGPDESGNQTIKQSNSSSLICFGGAVGGALAFAFSPVEWSQSTIVEIYSLNALFLMWVFLLSYRWMRRPSDKILWFIAFVFGLGLTNYQVLLFAIVPLALIIALRNISMFRDFALYLIPVLLCFQVLLIGSFEQSRSGMSKDVINKHVPVGVTEKRYVDKMTVDNSFGEFYQAVCNRPEWEKTRRYYLMRLNVAKKQQGAEGERVAQEAMAVLAKYDQVDRYAQNLDDEVKGDLKNGKSHELRASTERCPSGLGIVVSLVLLVGSLLLAVFFKGKGRAAAAMRAVLYGGGSGAGLLFLSGTLFTSCNVWEKASLATAPLVEPWIYAVAGSLVAVSVVASVAAAIRTSESGFPKLTSKSLYVVSGAAALLAVCVVLFCVPEAKDLAFFGDTRRFGYHGEPFPWFNHQLGFAALIVALFALSAFVKHGLSFAIPVAGFQTVLFLLVSRGALNGLTHPTSWWFWWPLAWNFVVLALAWHILPHGRSVAGAAFFAQLGISFYAYMPIVSDLRNPPMNWGYPRTWEGFKHAITRGQYEQIRAEDLSSFRQIVEFLWRQMGHYFADLKLQFTDFLVLFSVVPFACWQYLRRQSGRVVTRARALWVVAGLMGVLLLRDLLGSENPAAFSLWFDRALLVALMALALVGCLTVGFNLFLFRPAALLRRQADDCVRSRKMTELVALFVLGVEIPAVLLSLVWNGGLSGINGKIALAISAWVLVVGLFAFSFRFLIRQLRRLRRSVGVPVFEVKSVSQQWLISSGACFLMMSILLIVFAKVIGDVQDGFIQKVKFISSHAMIAMWIGYGLIVIAVMLLRLVPARFRRFVLLPLVLSLILGTAIPPLVRNYTNDQLVFELGGAEQNGHTFGWQFGAYQLDGAKAINEQLVADEEPLPDPTYPPPMDKFAIFFGGTDPGRFVPTYMIYSANFRPDIYLITQNALADDTYMSVERDLYGDEIWIPAKEDSAEAFDKYVTEVQSGVRPANGDLVIENGRVQVTGALGVMEINGILTKMMHDHDRYRHAFYVEESYVIPWMYPYLMPHGLIMKINADRKPYDEKRAAQDMDFWDWYVRRLLDDPMYRRDFAGQKSFSKLRAALAGLYNRCGRRAEAAQAFREAVALYPASPEATFRYAQEMLLPLGRWDTILEMLDYTDSIDPNNRRTAGLRNHVTGFRETAQEIERLEQKRRQTRKLSDQDAVTLANLKYGIGRVSEAAQLLRPLVGRVRDPAVLRLMSVVFLEARMNDEAYQTLESYLRMNRKNSAEDWLDYARAQFRTGRRTGAEQSLRNAVQADAQLVNTLVQRDQELYQIAAPLMQRRR